MPKRPRFNAPALSLAGALFLVISLAPHEFGTYRPAAADPGAGAQTQEFRGPGLADLMASAAPTDGAPAPVDRAAALAELRDLLQEAARHGSLACVETPYASALIHPDTPPERLPEILDWLQHFYGSQIDPSKSSFYKVGRWSVTASDTNTGNEGDPVTLSWSIVPDGTLIDNGSGGHIASNLQAVFDVNFPSHDTWVNQLRDCFARWAARTGIRYIEASDDGATAPESLGVLGV